MTKQKVLELLAASNAYISGEFIAKKLQISRAAVSKVVGALRRDGVLIESSTGIGYRLLKPDDLLDAQRILPLITAERFKNHLIVLPEVDSTNSYLKKLAENGAPDGTVVLADRQTTGRGRRMHVFESPSGGIYMSVLLRPKKTVSEIQLFTISAAVASVRAIEKIYGAAPDIKWINDLFWKGRKLSGILTEVSLSAEAGTVESIILGIGINTHRNVSGALRGQIASLEEISDVFHPRREVIAEILNQLETSGGDVLEEYKQHMFLLGKEVTLTGVKSAIGRAVDIGPDGSLILETADGRRESYNTGEVSIKQ